MTTTCPALDKDQTGQDLSGRDLRCYGNLSDYTFTKARLVGANLSGVVLKKAAIADADFSSANLTGADLSGAKGKNTMFAGANLTRTNLSGTELKSTNFAGVTWSATICPDGKTSDAKGGSCFR